MFYGFVTNAISGFDDLVLLHGGPFGGCAILYCQNFVSYIKQVKTPSHCFCAVMIDCHNCHCLLINIDLPIDYRSGAANEQLKETLGDLFLQFHMTS